MGLAAPSDWKISPFEEAFSRITNKANSVPSSLYQEFGRFPVIDQGKESFAGFVDDESIVFTCPKEGLIVFGDHTRIVKFVNRDFVLGADGTQLLQQRSGFDSSFLYHLLVSKEIPNTGYNRHFKYLKAMDFVKPSIAEQTLIATALSDIDDLISASKHLVNKKQSVLQAAFESEFSEVSGAVSTTLLEICEVSKGSAVKYDKHFIEGTFGYLNGGISFSGSTEIPNDEGDTVVVSEGGNSCGFVNYMPNPFWCGGHAYRLLRFKGIQKYLYYALKKSESEIMNLRVGSGLPNVQKKNLSEFKTLIHPEPKKQESVVAFLDSLSFEIEVLKSEITKFEGIKQGMAHDLLTGKVRLV
jgi:hypothetical protein